MSRFLGDEPTEKDHMYKNYRAFYGGATPSISKATQMGAAAQNQQKTLLRNKLAENAQRILETKSFVDERTNQILAERREMAKMSQSDVLAQNGFTSEQMLAQTKNSIYNAEPASYGLNETTGDAAFNYTKNKSIDKVTKTDPPLKNLNQGTRYNIITGSLQSWY